MPLLYLEDIRFDRWPLPQANLSPFIGNKIHWRPLRALTLTIYVGRLTHP